jgi:hypothetical protein
MGTSEAMIKAHYEHIDMRNNANEIAGKGSVDNVLVRTKLKN